MRPVLMGDVIALARALCLLPGDQRAGLAATLFYRAQVADKVMKRLRCPHPLWGNGSLMAVTSPLPKAPEAFLSDHAFLDSLLLVLRALRYRNVMGGRTENHHNGLDLRRNTLYDGVFNREGSPMAVSKQNVATVDPVWTRICDEAVKAIADEPLLGGLIHSSILHHPSFDRALAYRFSLKLASGEMSEQILREIADEAYASDPELAQAARADLMAVYERDPACNRFLQPLLFFKGYQALQAYRVGHWLMRQGRKDMAYFVQMRISEMFGVDIHPSARLGRGIMIDHAHSIVIGETAVVGDNVSMLHSVTLGGTGKEDGDRHPKIGNGVLIGAGAKVLGNITVGHCSRIAAGSVVLHDIPPCKTVAGVPARVVGEAGCDQPSVMMDQVIAGNL